jgi:hypothetical protein
MRLGLLLPLLLTACGVDNVGSNGELGRLSFSLGSDWYLEPTQLTDVGIVTGHSQSLGISLTERGEHQADDHAHAITYAVTPSAGVTLEQGGGEDTDDTTPPWLSLTVSDPDLYSLEADLDGELFDRIQLRFDTPTSLELTQFTRAPYADDFVALPATATATVAEGTQLAWLPIPIGDSGERLAGELGTAMTADPQDLVVPAANVSHVNEDQTYGDTEVASLYFIEPGAVTVTVADTVNAASASQAFEVTAAE